jgi:hypothetical protein
MREVRRVQNAIEQTTLVWTVSLGRTLASPAGAIVAGRAVQRFRMATTSTTSRFRHGPAMIPVPMRNKQS